MKTPEQIAEIKNSLAQFSGSSVFYRHMGCILTDGAKYVAEICEAFWLMDLIASHCISNQKVKKQPFQVYKLKVNKKANIMGLVKIEDGNNNLLDMQGIEYTDFPLDEITLWCVNKTIMLPSEY